MNNETTCFYCGHTIVREGNQWFALNAQDSEICFTETFAIDQGKMVWDIPHTDDADPAC